MNSYSPCLTVLKFVGTKCFNSRLVITSICGYGGSFCLLKLNLERWEIEFDYSNTIKKQFRILVTCGGAFESDTSLGISMLFCGFFEYAAIGWKWWGRAAPNWLLTDELKWKLRISLTEIDFFWDSLNIPMTYWSSHMRKHF